MAKLRCSWQRVVFQIQINTIVHIAQAARRCSTVQVACGQIYWLALCGFSSIWPLAINAHQVATTRFFNGISKSYTFYQNCALLFKGITIAVCGFSTVCCMQASVHVSPRCAATHGFSMACPSAIHAYRTTSAFTSTTRMFMFVCCMQTSMSGHDVSRHGV